jgi:hypothetical protein
MRMKTVDVIRAVGQWVDRLLAVRLPNGALYGLRTAERRFWRRSNLWMTQR